MIQSVIATQPQLGYFGPLTIFDKSTPSLREKTRFLFKKIKNLKKRWIKNVADKLTN